MADTDKKPHGDAHGHGEPDPASLKAGYEKSDARVSPFFAWSFVVLVIVAAVFVLAYPLASGFRKLASRADVPPSPIAGSSRELPPQPNLQVSPRKDMDDYRARELAHLASYGTDPETGRVFIPVDKAMDKALAKGFPVRADAATSEALEAHAMIPSRSSSGRATERRDR